MAKKGKRIDPNQLSFDFDQKIAQYQALKTEILEGKDRAPAKQVESHEEICIQIAAAIKRSIRFSGLSREQMVDEINLYFGWTGKKTLSIHMLNHYLSKPAQYPIPAFYIFAIQSITGSLEPTMTIADAEDAQVISGDEVRQMKMGKLDETILELQRLKKDLRGR